MLDFLNFKGGEDYTRNLFASGAAFHFVAATLAAILVLMATTGIIFAVHASNEKNEDSSADVDWMITFGASVAGIAGFFMIALGATYGINHKWTGQLKTSKMQLSASTA